MSSSSSNLKMEKEGDVLVEESGFTLLALSSSFEQSADFSSMYS